MTWEEDYPRQKRFSLVGIQDQQQSLINLDFRQFNQKNPNIMNNVTSQVKIEVSSVMIDLQMQPLLRMNDLLMDCLAQVGPPSMKYPPQLSGQAVQELLLVHRNELKKQFDDPEWMALHIHIVSPTILVNKTRNDHKNRMTLQMADIWIENTIGVTQPRIMTPSGRSLEEVYVEVYKISMNNLSIDLLIVGQFESVCNKFDLNVQVVFPKNPELYPEIRPDHGYHLDPLMAVNIRILPVIFGLKRKEYLFIMTLLFFNISYDDLQDCLYLCPLPESKAEFPKREEQPNMTVQLDLENLSLIVQNDDKFGSPLSRITLNKMRVSVEMAT